MTFITLDPVSAISLPIPSIISSIEQQDSGVCSLCHETYQYHFDRSSYECFDCDAGGWCDSYSKHQCENDTFNPDPLMTSPEACEKCAAAGVVNADHSECIFCPKGLEYRDEATRVCVPCA